jgi:hypothetical protein
MILKSEYKGKKYVFLEAHEEHGKTIYKVNISGFKRAYSADKVDNAYNEAVIKIKRR